MKVALFFPPATDPRAPHLALPSLTASLRRGGIEVRQRDLDLEGLLWLTRPAVLSSAVNRLQAGGGMHVEPERRARLQRLSEGLVERVSEALAVLRDPVRFFDVNELNGARANLDVAVAVASAAAPGPVTYSLEPIRYDLGGCDARRLKDLIEATARPETNLFHDFWEDEVLPGVEASETVLAGVSLTNRQQLIPGLALARRLKERGHFVVLGGTLVTKFADDLVRWPEFFETFASGVIVFEGETALLELLSQLEQGRDFSRVPNFRYLEGGTVRATPPHFENVEELPTPDFAGLPLGDYLVPRPVLPIFFGKGCYHSRCSFCDIPHVNRVSPSRYRRRSPARIVEDVRSLEQRFGARHFVVTDESLAPDVLSQVAQAFEAEPERFSFAGYARMEAGFTPDLCRRIARLGVRKLVFGLESGSQRTLDHMCKGTDVGEAPRILRACRDAGIRFHLFGMIGLPGEDEASARETLAFLVDNRDLIDHPGNSFDVHRFGLDVRAGFFRERERHGLLVDPEVLRQDLVVSLSRCDWRDTRGLSGERVEQLLDEFQETLRRTYVRSHNAPRHLWPLFEEHAVLYGDFFRDRAFPFGSGVGEGDEGRFRLRRSPACGVRTTHDEAVFTSYWDSAELPTQIATVLMDTRARTLADLAAECLPAWEDGAGKAEELIRDVVCRLISAGILQLEWVDRPGVANPGATAGGAWE